MTINYTTVRTLIVIGAIFTPFTALRFGPVGLGELFLIAAFLMLMSLNDWKLAPLPAIRPVLAFWGMYLVCIFVGFSYNVLALGYSSGNILLAGFDLAAYLLVVVLTMVLGDRNFYNGETPFAFFERVFMYWAIIFTALFALSQFTASIAGFPLRYFGFFSPLVDNLHQAAMITSAMPFVMLFLATQVSSLAWKVVHVIFAALFILMALDSGSSKAFMATSIGALAVLAMWVAHRPTGRGRVAYNTVAYSLTAGGLLLLVGQYGSILATAVQAFFIENDGGSAREILYSEGFSHTMQSPVFGYGPGPHLSLNGELYDAHSTVITIVLQGGLVAGLLLLVLCFHLIRRASVSSVLIGAIAAIAIYSLGGDILRRLPIWIIIISVQLLSVRQLAPAKTRMPRVARARH